MDTGKKSALNKTIDVPLEQCGCLLERCLREEMLEKQALTPEAFIDKTVIGDAVEVMKNMPKGFADLIIADPPYNLSKNFHGETFKKASREQYAEFTRKWLEAAVPLLKPNGSVYVCSDWQTSLVIEAVLSDLAIIRNRITWQREKGRGAAKNWKNGMEDIWFATLSDEYTFNLDAVKMRRRVVAPYRNNGRPKDWVENDDGNFRLTCPSNFWDDITVPYWSMKENTEHPTQKPEKLAAKLILASTNENDIVFDPFLGSGTTSVAAKKLGRHYVGIEQNELYCAWAQLRLDRADDDRTIQGYHNGVFYERNTPVIRS